MAQRFAGIDYGAARVGLAFGDDEVRMAKAHTTVSPGEVVGVLEADCPLAAIIVGLPRGLDGSETPQSLAVRRFAADHLEGIGPEVVFQDEFATSSVAEERLKESGRKYAKADIDAEAAAIILQDYLDAL